ncbi:hypothetical protein PVIIG_02624 [Plasmodium vivax India VII]|uniref:Uncharacterized protein n=4 Tax=Plasmodium vivax TaxID=5855 RepID=A5K730_PLAVS|nr:hypothetical protein PVX_100010 [Plasmodium vivax]EDL45121.1 hypothetical protein PVX_100010 [Plasmodium vivax]KMZ81142.1 hypothetical protein PVIIG_02624 [Plasmodium vivax India VII]KMZ87261.1 hypothetical protein PVBG_05252 [Plasmodium vivax Brazil I]KMZ93817.1 hypothetical protein PVMG_05070 [Plasmodium vivax Mauritania I]|eukprot:XP_001614848.1 hypothetical protein [Plasmodium vivax Sal-1]
MISSLNFKPSFEMKNNKGYMFSSLYFSLCCAAIAFLKEIISVSSHKMLLNENVRIATLRL